jgi:hypothetical protein
MAPSSRSSRPEPARATFVRRFGSFSGVGEIEAPDGY